MHYFTQRFQDATTEKWESTGAASTLQEPSQLQEDLNWLVPDGME